MTVSYPTRLTFVLGAQKDHLLDTVLSSTHSKCLITSYEGLKGIDILLF